MNGHNSHSCGRDKKMVTRTILFCLDCAELTERFID